jgi:hypothetical protein
MRTDYSDEVARFTDELCADTLARFISSKGIPCDVQFVNGPGLAKYRVTVSRALRGKLTQAVKLTQVAKYADPVSAEVVAGRLVREKIPCIISGGAKNLLGSFGSALIPLNGTGDIMGCSIAVPHAFLKNAQRVLDASDISEAELTKLALGSPLDREDPS